MTQTHAAQREAANALAFDRLAGADPILVDVRPAIEALPGMTPNTVLTSGAPMPWEAYFGGQRQAVIGGAIYEGLATDEADVDTKIGDGRIRVASCHAHGCVGSLAGIYTASMPVFVVEDPVNGTRGHCNIYEGPSLARLNYGVYNQEVRQNLKFLEHVLAPTLAQAIRQSGGIPLRPLIRRALNMGDDLHSRNTAASLLFIRELFPHLLQIAGRAAEPVQHLLSYFKESDYFFLRLAMAAAKATADAAHNVEGSSLVTAMTFSCREYAIRVSGLGDTWFRAPMPKMEAKLFDGFSEDDVEYMGGESVINETVGLGGFAQAAAFPLQAYGGGTPEIMVQRNLAMYQITVGEHPEFKIPFLAFRGTPLGIDIHKVVETGVTPVANVGVAGRGGGQIGAGSLFAPADCFHQAKAAYDSRYR